METAPKRIKMKDGIVWWDCRDEDRVDLEKESLMEMEGNAEEEWIWEDVEEERISVRC